MSNEPNNMARDFKGVWIPKEVFLHKHLHPVEKLIWVEIHSLYSKEKRGCYASNKYLAEFFGVGETYISKAISKLKSFGLIEDVCFDGRQRIIRAVTPPEDFENDKADLHCSARQKSKTCTTVQGRHELQSNPLIIYSNTEFSNTSEASIKSDNICSAMSSLSFGRARFFYEKLKEINPMIREPNFKKWEQDLEKILKVDKRTEEQIKEVIEFIVNQHKTSTEKFTWSGAVQSPQKLREHFAAIWLQMKKPSKASAVSIKDQIKSKGFKHGDFYNGAECFIDDNSVAFQRGTTHKSVKFSEKGFWDQFDSMVRFFNIRKTK